MNRLFESVDKVNFFTEDEKSVEKSKGSTRLIALMDGTGMGGELIVFETNAPAERLKELEKESCQVYIDGGDYDDIPIWSKVLEDEGYIFDYVDSCDNMSAYSTSDEWLEDKYPEVKETYIIDDQPELSDLTESEENPEYYVKLFVDSHEIEYTEFDDEWEAERYAKDCFDSGCCDEAAVYYSRTKECISLYDDIGELDNRLNW